MVDAPTAGYGEMCQEAYGVAIASLGRFSFLDPIELWTRLRHQLFVDTREKLTWLMWSTAVDTARQDIGLAPFGPYPVALVGEMDSPHVQRAARLLLEGTAGGVPAMVIAHAIKRQLEGVNRG